MISKPGHNFSSSTDCLYVARSILCMVMACLFLLHLAPSLLRDEFAAEKEKKIINTTLVQDTTAKSHLCTCKEPLCTEVRICFRLPSPRFDRGDGRHAVPWGVLSRKNTIRGFVFSVCRNDCLQIIYRPKMNPSAVSTNNAGSRSAATWSPPALLLQHFFITTFPSQPPGCLGCVPPCATILHCRLQFSRCRSRRCVCFVPTEAHTVQHGEKQHGACSPTELLMPGLLGSKSCSAQRPGVQRHCCYYLNPVCILGDDLCMAG